MMRRLLLLALVLLGLASPAQAQRPRAVGVEAGEARFGAIFEAADRGDDQPLRDALATERTAAFRTLIQSRLAAMRLDPAILRDRRLRRLASAGQPAKIRSAALSILTSAAFAQSRYADAARTGAALLDLQRASGDRQGAGDTAQTLAIARLLAAEPRLDGSSWTPGRWAAARRDRAGLTRVDLAIDGQRQEAVFDTGANLSVLSASTARRLGVRMLTGNASVGNGVQTDVAVRLAIADRVEVSGATLHHSVFLVIDDAALTFPGGYSIPAILGFPEMRALGRMRMAAGRFTVEPLWGASLRLPNLRAVENSLVVDARVGGIAVPLHLDSGANPTHFNPAFAAAHPQIVAGLAREEHRLASAGGTATGQAVHWSDVPVELAGRATRMPDIVVGMSAAGKPSDFLGVIGADLLGRFANWTLDLRAMRLELGAPAPKPR